MLQEHLPGESFLKTDQIIKLPSGALAEVLTVNESRARIKLLTKTEKHIHTANDEDVSFFSSGREFDISPNSEVEIISQGAESKAPSVTPEEVNEN